MRYRWDKKYLYWGVTAFLVIAAGIILVAMLFKISAILSVLSILATAFTPVLYGVIIAFLVDPVVRFCERIFKKINKNRISDDPIKRKKQKKRWRVYSILISIVFVFAIVTGLIMLVIPQLIVSMTKLVTNFQTYYESFSTWIKEATKGNEAVSNMVDSVFGQGFGGIISLLKDTLLPQWKELLSTLTTGVMGVIGVLKDLLIGFIIAIYFLYSKEKFVAHVKMVIYSIFRKRTSNSLIGLGRDVNKYFGGFITGKILDSAIIGVICFIVMSIFHFDYALLISVIVGVTNIIPFFGPFIGAIPSALFLLMIDPMEAVWFVIWILILQQLDGNLIGPLILGNRTGISGFWVITSIAVFGSLFGLIGIIIAVPLCAVLLVLLRRRVFTGLRRRKMEINTEVFMKPGVIYEDDNPRSDHDDFYKEPIKTADLQGPPEAHEQPEQSKLITMAKKLWARRNNYRYGDPEGKKAKKAKKADKNNK